MSRIKVGRNDRCPCRSGKKFKQCHLAAPRSLLIPASPPEPSPIPPHVWAEIDRRTRRERAQEQARITAYGNTRPIIHVPDYAGYQLVVVRNRVYYSKKWKYFTDFLFDYGIGKMGQEWFEDQKSKAITEQHPLWRLRAQAYDFMNRQPPAPDGTYSGIPNGPMAACNNFYYDLYTVDDNSLFDDSLLQRLRHRDQFQGALHELFVEATCLRAGFSVIRENERDGSRRHVEFTAVHKETGQHVLVEAKSRHRAGILGQAGVPSSNPDIRFNHLINDAVAKDPHNPLAVFVDTNLSAERAHRFYELQSREPVLPSKTMAALIEKVRQDYGGVDPYNILVFSNHPQHYALDERRAPGNRWAAFISRKARVPVHHEKALFDLWNAVNVYGNVPSKFPPPRESTITDQDVAPEEMRSKS